LSTYADRKQVLEQIDFFSGLDRKLLDKVAEASLLRTYPRDEIIIRQGEIGLGLYAIIKGRVKVEREHKGHVTELAELGQGQFFAEISMIDSKPRSATITTLEETECMLLTRDSFLKLVRVYPELALRLARVLAERLRRADELLVEREYESHVSQPRNQPVETRLHTNGAPASARPSDPGGLSKARVQASMLDTFRNLYSMKALVRFSVAVLGCPVEGAAANALGQIRVGEAKAILLPAGEDVALDIIARQNGDFTLHVFHPDAQSPLGYGPLAIEPADRYQLRISGPSVALWNANSIIDPAAGGV
jgi:CRP/FNR family transcriptional regulator, cyclic AMP receptor protein